MKSWRESEVAVTLVMEFLFALYFVICFSPFSFFSLSLSFSLLHPIRWLLLLLLPGQGRGWSDHKALGKIIVCVITFALGGIGKSGPHRLMTRKDLSVHSSEYVALSCLCSLLPLIDSVTVRAKEAETRSMSRQMSLDTEWVVKANHYKECVPALPYWLMCIYIYIYIYMCVCVCVCVM